MSIAALPPSALPQAGEMTQLAPPQPNGVQAGVATPAQPQDAQIDAFSSALQQAGGAQNFGNPSVLGQSVLATFQSFPKDVARMNQLADSVQQRMAAPASAPASAADALSQQRAEQKQQVGLMLEMFDFATETQMVASAATQFTSSVNSLMKAQ